jgi:L-seryl-tRNA(Ser) seleniumtransferase
VDKLTLAALEATLLGPQAPVLSILDVPVETLTQRAESILGRLDHAGIEAEVVPSRAAVGGGGAPGVELPSVALSLPKHYAVRLRAGRPVVVGRIEADRCLLDLRTVLPDQDEELVTAVTGGA